MRARLRLVAASLLRGGLVAGIATMGGCQSARGPDSESIRQELGVAVIIGDARASAVACGRDVALNSGLTQEAHRDLLDRCADLQHRADALAARTERSEKWSGTDQADRIWSEAAEVDRQRDELQRLWAKR